MSLQQVLQRPDVWRGDRAPAVKTVPSGHGALDALLPGGGWPVGALTEIVGPGQGAGELRLLLPALARLSRGDRWIAFVAPPCVPYAPALATAGVELSRLLLVHPKTGAEHLWAVETALRAGACAAVLAWPEGVGAESLRRWQLAAEAGESWGVLFARRAVQGSPAALRLAPAPAGAGAIDVRILKCRGGWPAGPLRLETDHALAVRAPAGPVARDLQPRRIHG